MREWLPPALGGGGEASNVPSSSAPQPSVTVFGRMQTSARERTQNMQNAASMAGLPVSSANDSAFAACCPKLTYKERVYGCVACFCLGFVIGLLSFVAWWTGSTATWAIMYTIGNIVSLCSSGFLLTPQKQLKNMSKAKRRIAAGIYITAILITLIGGFMDWPGPILILLVFVQWCALIWYFASYIPYGQKMISRALGKALDW